MEQVTHSFRKKSIPAQITTSKEVLDSSKISIDTMQNTELITNQLDSKLMTFRKIRNLFSMTGDEFREIRGNVHSLREAQIRYEEALDTLRLQITKVMEQSKWQDMKD